MCVKDGTEVEFHCPILNCDYLNWEPQRDYYYYYDGHILVNRFNVTLSDGHGFQEISCDCSDAVGPSYHALLIVTGEHTCIYVNLSSIQYCYIAHILCLQMSKILKYQSIQLYIEQASMVWTSLGTTLTPISKKGMMCTSTIQW